MDIVTDIFSIAEASVLGLALATMVELISISCEVEVEETGLEMQFSYIQPGQEHRLTHHFRKLGL